LNLKIDKIQEELQCNIAKSRLDAERLQRIAKEKEELEKNLKE